MALVPDEHDQFPAKPASRASLKSLEVIKNCLNKDNQRLFRRSCFGQFFRMAKMKFQGKLYLHLLFRQDMSNSNEKIIFHINNKETEFGMREFSLMTGLRFGRLPDIPTTSVIHEEVFGEKTTLHVLDIEKALKEAAGQNNGGGETTLKLALLYFLFGILIVRDKSGKKIDIQYIHVADDLDMFNNFPWGRVAFEFLVQETRSCMDGRVEKYRERKESKSNHKYEKFDIYGVGYALQAWAYEIMPDLAKRYATVVEENKDRIPRILRWTASLTPKFEDLKRNIFFTLKGGDQIADHVIIHPKLEATEKETKTPYYEGLVAWIEELERSKREDAERRAALKRKRSEEEKEEEEQGTTLKRKQSKDEENEQEVKEKQEQRTKLYHDPRYAVVMHQMTTLIKRVENVAETVRDKDEKLEAIVKDKINTLEATVKNKIDTLEATVTTMFRAIMNKIDCTSPVDPNTQIRVGRIIWMLKCVILLSTL